MRINSPQLIVKRVLGVGLMGLLIAGFMQPPLAEAKTKKAEKNEKIESKKVKGEVVSITKDMIAVEYYRREGASKEILIPFEPETLLSRFRDMDELGVGDTVSVIFKETYILDEEGKRSNFKRVAGQIILIRRALKNTLESR